MSNNKLYQINSFVKLILFILSTILTILNNNILVSIFIFCELTVIILLLIKNKIYILVKYVVNIPFVIIMFIIFLCSKSLFLVLFMIYLKLLILLMTTLPTHLILSIVKLFHPLSYLKIDIKKLVFLIVYVVLYLKLFKSNLNSLIKNYKYRSINIFKTVLKNNKDIFLYSIYLTKYDVINSLQEINLNNLNTNIKSQFYGEKKANLKDYLLVALYIGIIVLSLTKEVFGV